MLMMSPPARFSYKEEEEKEKKRKRQIDLISRCDLYYAVQRVRRRTPLSVHRRLGSGAELGSLHDDDGLALVDLDGGAVVGGSGERGVDERRDVLDELVVEGVAEHGLWERQKREAERERESERARRGGGRERKGKGGRKGGGEEGRKGGRQQSVS
jgi:hypothetical protein